MAKLPKPKQSESCHGERHFMALSDLVQFNWVSSGTDANHVDRHSEAQVELTLNNLIIMTVKDLDIMVLKSIEKQAGITL